MSGTCHFQRKHAKAQNSNQNSNSNFNLHRFSKNLSKTFQNKTGSTDLCVLHSMKVMKPPSVSGSHKQSSKRNKHKLPTNVTSKNCVAPPIWQSMRASSKPTGATVLPVLWSQNLGKCDLKWRPATRSEKMPQIEWFRACSNCPAGSSEHKVDHGSNDQLSKLKELRFRFLKLMQSPNFLIWYLAVDVQSLVDQYPEIWKHTAPPQSLGPIKQWTCGRPAFPQYTFKFSIPVDI